MRILFLGNSFTFFNDLPALVAELLQAEVGRSLRGGASLIQHLNPTDELCTLTHRLLTEERWNFVVLQDHSRGPIEHAEDFRRALDALCPMIRAAGAQPVLYETWAYEEGSEMLAKTGLRFDEMQQRLTDAYRDAAEAHGTLLAPVGQAFSAARHTVALYNAQDHFHPSEAGSRLAAETIAATIRAAL